MSVLRHIPEWPGFVHEVDACSRCNEPVSWTPGDPLPLWCAVCGWVLVHHVTSPMKPSAPEE